MSIEAMKATPHKQLIDELMDSRIPKTEREHAAAREIERLRQAIEAAEKQEPVCVAFIRQLVSIDKDGIETWKDEPLYISPPKREWVGLTDEEIMEMLDYGQYGRVPQYARNFVDAIEAKLREKNHG